MAPPAPPSVPIVVIPDEDDDDYFDDLMARANYAEAKSAECLEQIHNLEQQIDILIARVATADALSADLQGQLLTTRRGMIPRGE
jgi:multidrug resistance efflux pump